MKQILQRSHLGKVAIGLWTASLGVGMAQGTPFRDVAPTLEDIRFLYLKGIVQGFPDGTFRGNRYLTRYQGAAMLYRAYLVFASDVAQRVRAALAEEEQVHLNEALVAINELKEGLEIVQRAMGEFPEVKATLEETRKNVESLAEELAQVTGQMVTREEIAGQIGDLVASVGALETLLQRGEQGLTALQTRVTALEAVLREFEQRTQAADAETNRRVFDLAGRVDQLEREKQERPRLRLGGLVGVSDGKPAGEIFASGEAGDVRLEGAVNQHGVQVQAQRGGLTLNHTQRAGLAESRIEYSLWHGISLRLGAGYGESAFATAAAVHAPDGGLIPGLVGKARVGIGFHQGEASRSMLQFRLGYRFGEVTPSLGFVRFQGPGAYSLLEARLDWQAGIGTLTGFYRAIAFPGAEPGSEYGLRLTTKGNPFFEVGVRGWSNTLPGEPGSFTFKYQSVLGTGTDFTLRIGYALEF